MTRNPLRSLLRSWSGTATIELALIAPMFVTLLIGVVDVTMGYNRKLVLEQATQRGIEKIMQTTTDKTVDETIIDDAAAAADVPADQVDLQYWLECDGEPVEDYTADCDTGEVEARYLTLSITDTFTPMFPLAHLGMDMEHFTIRAESGIRTR